MKNKIFILCAMIFFISMAILAYVEFGFTTPSAWASKNTQTISTTTTGANGTADAENDIRAILEEYYRFTRTNDRAALKKFSRAISATEYLYSSELGTMDKEATLRMLESLKSEYVSTVFEDISVQVYGDTAIAKYLDVSEIRTGRDTQKKQTRFTNVWVKQNGAWKIVAEHSSVLPPAKLLPRHPLADKIARK